MKKVISVLPYSGGLFAVCDDGTIWYRAELFHGDWRRVQSVPQPAAEKIDPPRGYGTIDP